jgi:hypothetical protein
MLKFSTNVLVMLPSALSTWSLLCDGRHSLAVVILFQFLACLRVHSVEGSNGELWLLLLVVVPMKSFRKEIFISERVFRSQGRGQLLGIAEHTLVISTFDQAPLLSFLCVLAQF